MIRSSLFSYRGLGVSAAFFALAWLSAYPAEVDPRLAAKFAGTQPAWIILADKGAASPAALAAARAEAKVWITARALARRTRRGEAAPAISERDFPAPAEQLEAVLACGAKRRAESRWFNALSVEATSPQIAAIARLPFVKTIEPVRTTRRPPEPAPFQPKAAPIRPAAPLPGAIGYGNSLAQLQQIDVPAAHSAGYDGTGVVVGILDTGFYKEHEALSTRTLLGEKDFVFNDNDVQQDLSNPLDYSDFHGTGVWSILGGFKDGTLAGPAYNAQFLLAKTEDLRSETPAEEDYWVAGIEWMEANGADIVSSSLAYLTFDGGGGYSYSDLNGNTAKVTIAADIAASLGVVVCNAMGNSGPAAGTLDAPADANDILSCGAVDLSGILAGFSSRGPTFDGRIKPEVCACGVNDWLASNNRSGNTYVNGSGTSFATPLVAGAAALVVQAHPDWPASMVRKALKDTASQRAAPDNNYGWGVIDVMAAIGYTHQSATRGWGEYR